MNVIVMIRIWSQYVSFFFEVKMKKSLHRQYRYILFVGLTLWLIGDTIYLCCNSTPANDTAFGLISCDITFWTILGVTVIGAFEEYVFRGWTTRYKKAILWSLIFQTVYCLFTAGWLIGAAVGILSVCIFFILKQYFQIQYSLLYNYRY